MKTLFRFSFQLILIFQFFQLQGQTTVYDFETGLNGFDIHTSGNLTATIETTNEDSNNGEYSMVCEITNSGNGNIQLVANKMDVNPGDKFSVRFFMRCNHNRIVKVKSQYSLASGGVKVFFEQSNVSINTDWKELEVDITVPNMIDGQIPKDVFIGFIEQKVNNVPGLKYFVDDYEINYTQDTINNEQQRDTTDKRVAELIYVSNKGDDSCDGSIEQPLKTINTALEKAESNDTIILMGGVYQEANTITRNGISIRALPGTTPFISGLDTIQASWTKHIGNIYKTQLTQKVTQLFIENQNDLAQMVYARYPNLTSDDLFQQTYAVADVVDYNSNAASTLRDSHLSELSGINLVGAAIWLPYPFITKWNSNTEIVTSQTSTTLGFKATKDEEAIAGKGNTNVDYHLTGTLSLLDVEKEWYYDAESNTLYFYAPQGMDPGTLKILARTRDIGISSTNTNNITIKGITFQATGLIAKGDNITISECNFYYPTPFFHTERWKERADFSVAGNGNLVEKCEVAYSWGTGISMRNSTQSSVENCLVYDCNWSGSISPGIWLDGTKLKASKNTIYRVGRSGIRIYNIYNSIIEKNHVYDYGLINHDLGGIKGGLQDYKHSVWRYNFCHDMSDSYDKAKAGLYLDASNDNATLHHNINYGVHLSVNGNVNNDSIINNTFVRHKNEKVWSHYIRPGTDWDYHSVYTFNNLGTNTLNGTELQNNLVDDIDSFKFAGIEYGDFRLKINSPAIDEGLNVGGINVGYVANAPDVGAYEYGDTSINGNWIAGITWSPEWNSQPTGKIEVAKDSSFPSEYQFSAKNDSDEDGWIMRYDWDFGDGTQGYGKTVKHVYADTGSYTVSLKLRDNLAATTNISINIKIDSVGVLTSSSNHFFINPHWQSSGNKLEFYPNPVTDRLKIKAVNLDEENNLSIEILDCTGRRIKHVKTNQKITELRLGDLLSGSYLINITGLAAKKKGIIIKI